MHEIIFLLEFYLFNFLFSFRFLFVHYFTIEKSSPNIALHLIKSALNDWFYCPKIIFSYFADRSGEPPLMIKHFSPKHFAFLIIGSV